MNLRLVIYEMVGQGTREYTELRGNLPQRPQCVKGEYDVYHLPVEFPLEGMEKVPIPCNGYSVFYLNGVLMPGNMGYSTPSHPNPHQSMQQDAPGGQVLKYINPDGVPLPDTLPMDMWMSAIGMKGDPMAARIKLKRVKHGHNIHSDSIGNMYLYYVHRVYIYLKRV